MEKGINTYIREQFEIEEADIKSYSPLTLAFIGDAIYDLIIRTGVVAKGNTRADKLQRRTVTLVKAGAQSDMIEAILPFLTEEEDEVYKRGRNAKSHTMPKNATVADYRRATGFEALLGYLYLKDDMDRIMELIKTGINNSKLEAPWDTKN